MSKKQVPIHALAAYLPDNCCDEVLEELHRYKVHLTITRHRQSILGDYRHAFKDKAHRISVNGNLNKFSFLITLLHELAHLYTFEKYGNRVSPHGIEWKSFFSEILSVFVKKKIFPADIESALNKTLKNPAASSCGDEQLLRVLRNYDAKKDNHCLIEQLPIGTQFVIKGNRKFIKESKVRSRYKCLEIDTKKYYLFHGLYEVQLLENLPE